MMAFDAAHDEEEQNRRPEMTRRVWLQRATGAFGFSVFALAPLLAQDPKLTETIRTMSTMTRTELPESWVEPTASLVGVILDYSHTLRALDLGEMEPATYFVAR